MRPKSIIHAERLYLAATALLLASSLAVWTPLVETYGLAFAIGVTGFLIGLFLLLILFTTRRGSNVARWLLTLLTAFGALSFLWQIGTGLVALGWPGVINALQVTLTVIGAVLLFRPNAAAWFARPHENWEEDV